MGPRGALSPEALDAAQGNQDTFMSDQGARAELAKRGAPGPDAADRAVFAPEKTKSGEGNAPAFPPVKTTNIPAHELSTVSPTTQKMYDEAGAAKMGAAGEAQTAEVGANEAKAGSIEGIAGHMQADSLAAEQREAARAKAMGEQNADYDRLRREVDSGKPDYDRWTHGHGGSMMAAIAQALGAAGAALSHGPNTAADIIKHRIDTNIAEQRDALDQKGKAADRASHSLQIMRERFGDERAAEAAERAKQIQMYLLRGDAEVARAQSPMLGAKWDGVKADLLGEQAKLHQMAHQWVQAATVTTGGPGAGGNISDVKPDEVMQLHDGRYVTVPEKDREKVVQAQNKADGVRQAGEAVKRLASMSTVDRMAHPLDWKKEYDAASKTLAAAEIESGGKGGKGIFEAFQKAAGGRTLIWTPGVDKAVTQIVGAAQRNAQNEIENSAQYEVTPQLVRNHKTGIVERKHSIVGPFKRPPPQGVGDKFFKKAGGE